MAPPPNQHTELKGSTSKTGLTTRGDASLRPRQDSELLLRESRAEQSAEVALKAQLAEERRKAKAPASGRSTKGCRDAVWGRGGVKV